MLFLQEYGVSTLFAVKIFKVYGNNAIEIVKNNPYKLTKDIYGIGFFSADKIALNLGIEQDNPIRIRAAIAHVLAASRTQGHCYLELEYLINDVEKLLKQDFREAVEHEVEGMERENELKTRIKKHEKKFCKMLLFKNPLL